MMLQVTEEQSINGALMLCTSGIQSGVRFAGWLKKHCFGSFDFTGNIFPASSAIPPAFMYPPALNTPWRRSRSTAPSRGACWLSGESYGATPFPKAVTIRYRKPAASAANHHPL